MLIIHATKPLEVRGDVRKNIDKRTALMDLKWAKVTIKKAVGCKNKHCLTIKNCML